MLWTTIKIAFRNLLRQKIYSFIIILSLAFGLSISNILFVFLYQELSTDSFHSKKERIYRLLTDNPMGQKGKISFILEISTDHIAVNYPEIEAICKVVAVDELALSNEEILLEDLIILGADSSFFKLFDFPLLQGNKEIALQPGGIVITKHLAEVIFGHPNVMGEELLLQQKELQKVITVTGVLDDNPSQSHLKFDALVSYAEFNNPWWSVDYLLLNANTNPIHLEDKINQDKNVPGLLGPGKSTFFLQPLKEVYFDQDNTRPYSVARASMFIWIGWTVSILILLIAGFNFINLFLLLLMKRKKEFGIKKVLGASVASIRNTTITEVFIYVSLSYALSLFLTLFFLPEFNNSLNTAIEFSDFSNFNVVIAYGAIIFLLSAVVVFYLSGKLSKLPPISVISGNVTSRVKFNKVMLQFQFVISIVLTICAITIIAQINYIKNKPLGFNRNLIELEVADSIMKTKLPVLKQKLLEISGINNVAITNGNPLGNWKIRYELENDEYYTPNVFSGDEDLINTFGLELIRGDYHNRKGEIVNETLVKYFNFIDPLGETLPGTKNLIIAVVKDFNIGSFKNEIPPVVISLDENDPLGKSMILDYPAGKLAGILPEIEKSWQRVYPDYPFGYRLIEDELIKAHKDDLYFLKIIVSFSLISILITCFGLFSLAWAITQNRTKEIGIRKVIGATFIDIFRLLTVDFSKWILVAFILATPIAWYLMNEWLQNFSFRIKLSPVIFMAGGIIIFVIALLTVSIHAIRAARVNPVDELRNE